MSRVNKQIRRRDVEHLIAQGRKILVVDGDVLQVDAWLPFHPGGDKSILHMVGRDATDEVNALHSAEARRRMLAFRIGRLQGPWVNFTPPIQGGVFREHGSLSESSPQEPHETRNIPVSSSSSSSLSSLEEREASKNRDSRASSPSELLSSTTSSRTSLSLTGCEEDESPRNTWLAVQDQRTKAEIDFDLAKYPSLDDETQRGIVEKYRQLDLEIRSQGLYECNYRAYAIECARYALIFALFLFFLNLQWFGTSGLFLGLFWHQLVFTAHDAGHMGITHDFNTDTVIGIIIADFLGGLSLGWWKRNHNVHHIVTNSPEHDPDIEHMPLFAISHRFLESLKSTYYDRIMTYDAVAKFTVRYQHYLYYPVLLFGRFNLYRLSWEYLLGGQAPRKGPAWWHRHLELAGQVFFWTWFGYGVVYKAIPTAWGRFVFVMVSHMVTAPLHVQITLSHFAMSTSDLGVNESFPQKMLRTTMDVECPEWLDFVHGGLQFQAIHHLYPRIPRHNLRKTQRLVREFCQGVGIPYALYGFVDGNKEVIGKLGDVGRQAAILAECQRQVARDPHLKAH